MLLVVEDGEIPLVLGLAFCLTLAGFDDPLGKCHAGPVDEALENVCRNEQKRRAQGKVNQRDFRAWPKR